MSGKLFTYRRAGAPAWRWALCAALLGGAVGACHRPRVLTRPAAAVDTAVQPDRFAPAFRKLGAAHFRSVARFEAGVDGTTADSVTTETDIWIDARGNWRLVELNDKDGGREVVLHGHDLSVALRYGKMIRRAAEDPEPQHLLEEGLGGPFAAWNLLRNIATVDDFGEETRNGRKVHVYKLTKSPRPAEPAGPLDAADRRAWRQTLFPGSIDGMVVIDDATGLPLQADFRAQYSMRRPASSGAKGSAPEVPMHGALDVRSAIEDIGRSPDIARPEAEDLPARARTVPEEKALLSGLPRSTPAPKVTR